MMTCLAGHQWRIAAGSDRIGMGGDRNYFTLLTGTLDLGAA
jgi:hypothetical protein